MNQYGNPQYWEDRYLRDPEPFDWYQRFSGIKDLLLHNLNQDSQILNIGAGTSRLSEELYDEGYQNITSIDISQTVVKQMQEKYHDKGNNFKYLQMDVKQLEFESKSFDVVIDKGTLDCVLCGECSTANTSKALSEIYRVLTNQGVYFLVSHANPESRKNILQRPEFQWQIHEHQVPKPKTSAEDNVEKYHHIYICKKKVQEENQEEN